MTQTTTDHVARSLSHLEAAKAARLTLSEAYASPRQDRAEIAELHQAIGFGLKVAEIHALLALAPSPARDQGQDPVDQQKLDALSSERFKTPSRLS